MFKTIWFFLVTIILSLAASTVHAEHADEACVNMYFIQDVFEVRIYHADRKDAAHRVANRMEICGIPTVVVQSIGENDLPQQCEGRSCILYAQANLQPAEAIRNNAFRARGVRINGFEIGGHPDRYEIYLVNDVN